MCDKENLCNELLQVLTSIFLNHYPDFSYN